MGRSNNVGGYRVPDSEAGTMRAKIRDQQAAADAQRRAQADRAAEAQRRAEAERIQRAKDDEAKQRRRASEQAKKQDKARRDQEKKDARAQRDQQLQTRVKEKTSRRGREDTRTIGDPIPQARTRSAGARKRWSWPWFFVGAIPAGIWAYTVASPDGRWAAVGFVALIAGLILGRFYKAILTLAILAAIGYLVLKFMDRA